MKDHEFSSVLGGIPLVAGLFEGGSTVNVKGIFNHWMNQPPDSHLADTKHTKTHNLTQGGLASKKKTIINIF